MTNRSDAAVDALLRKHFDGPVPDNGFSDAVMQRLPPRRLRVAWPLWAGILAGIAACWLGLLRAPLLSAGWIDWMRGDWSIPAVTVALVIVGTSLLALWWSVSESETG